MGLPPETFSITTDGKLTIDQNQHTQAYRRRRVQRKDRRGHSPGARKHPLVPRKHNRDPAALRESRFRPLREIADSIKRDPGLTTALLKLANSAGYITIKKIETIEEAVKIIGTKGINMLLVATGVQKVLDSRYKKFETIWKNSL
ncbi:MAG: HDOD domain-containing protein [Spirochaetota bacterium]